MGMEMGMEMGMGMGMGMSFILQRIGVDIAWGTISTTIADLFSLKYDDTIVCI